MNLISIEKIASNCDAQSTAQKTSFTTPVEAVNPSPSFFSTVQVMPVPSPQVEEDNCRFPDECCNQNMERNDVNDHGSDDDITVPDMMNENGFVLLNPSDVPHIFNHVMLVENDESACRDRIHESNQYSILDHASSVFLPGCKSPEPSAVSYNSDSSLGSDGTSGNRDFVRTERGTVGKARPASAQKKWKYVTPKKHGKKPKSLTPSKFDENDRLELLTTAMVQASLQQRSDGHHHKSPHFTRSSRVPPLTVLTRGMIRHQSDLLREHPGLRKLLL